MDRALRRAMFSIPGFAGIICHRATERTIHQMKLPPAAPRGGSYNIESKRLFLLFFDFRQLRADRHPFALLLLEDVQTAKVPGEFLAVIRAAHLERRSDDSMVVAQHPAF